MSDIEYSPLLPQWLVNLDKSIRTAKAEAAEKHRTLAHWCELIDDFSYSSREFYTLVVKNLEARQVPGLEAGRFHTPEGGVLSARRIYLELRRERLVFEICAAPFGTGFFVSSRLFDRRREARAWHFLAVVLGLGMIGAFLWAQFGFEWSCLITAGVIAALWSLMRRAANQTALWLDEELRDFPVLGPIYETIFHPNTRYREDQNQLYRVAVERAVRETIQAIRTEQGIKPPETNIPRPKLADLA